MVDRTDRKSQLKTLKAGINYLKVRRVGIIIRDLIVACNLLTYLCLIQRLV